MITNNKSHPPMLSREFGAKKKHTHTHTRLSSEVKATNRQKGLRREPHPKQTQIEHINIRFDVLITSPRRIVFLSFCFFVCELFFHCILCAGCISITIGHKLSHKNTTGMGIKIKDDKNCHT